jgi:hypothetical protein
VTADALKRGPHLYVVGGSIPSTASFVYQHWRHEIMLTLQRFRVGDHVRFCRRHLKENGVRGGKLQKAHGKVVGCHYFGGQFNYVTVAWKDKHSDGLVSLVNIVNLTLK